MRLYRRAESEDGEKQVATPLALVLFFFLFLFFLILFLIYLYCVVLLFKATASIWYFSVWGDFDVL